MSIALLLRRKTTAGLGKTAAQPCGERKRHVLVERFRHSSIHEASELMERRAECDEEGVFFRLIDSHRMPVTRGDVREGDAVAVRSEKPKIGEGLHGRNSQCRLIDQEGNDEDRCQQAPRG